ncbi:hypothetical protein A2W24_05425 [Microgenomates group bacterium RBG_16_45_19]|nr:MAG: hypothetical protein A2W24_05425 [Microgenomates group bacterium RBG_16_45_19]
MKRQPGDLKPMSQVLADYVLEDKGGFITREWQDYGYRLAVDMGEETKKSMYIKLAKTTDRAVLEQARAFVLGSATVKNRGKLFMWAVGKLKRGEPLSRGEAEA